MPASTQLEPIYVDLTGAALLTTLSPSTIEKLVREGHFPRPRVLSRNRVGYLRSEIVAWAHERPFVESFDGQPVKVPAGYTAEGLEKDNPLSAGRRS